MTYKQVLDYMYKQLPMYQRIGPLAYKKDLGNIISLCKSLNNPQSKFKSIHVAGTNGKGSVSHMLSSIFQEAGYKTGLYTSPHLKDFRERIKANGVMISKYRVRSFIERNKKNIKIIKPSFFEITVAMAFDYFAKAKVDIAIIETGLGGRLDSTNIILPELSVITNISKDHTLMLGNTVKKIAREKAGIIKKEIPVVLGEYNKEYNSVFKDKCKKSNSKLYYASKNFIIRNNSSNNSTYQFIEINKKQRKKTQVIKTDLQGVYQAKNICTVLQCCEILNPVFHLKHKHIYKGLKKVKVNTGILGRWQITNKRPLTICDVGHNAEAIEILIKQINKTPHNKLHIVFGVVNDKSLNDLLKYLPNSAIYYFCKANVPRALDEKLLLKSALTFKLKGNSYDNVKNALKAAKLASSRDDLIFIGGSAFVCAEIL